MKAQKIALFSSTNEVGQRLAEEALKRGHTVTAIVSDEKEFKLKHPNLQVVKGDVMNKEEISKRVKGHDMVIFAHEPSQKAPREHVVAIHSLIEGIKNAGVQRFLATGYVERQPSEFTAEAYDAWKPVQQAQRDALKLLRRESWLHWGYACSPQSEPVQKNDKLVISKDILFTTPESENKLPAKNYTAALLDEAEKTEHVWEESGL